MSPLKSSTDAGSLKAETMTRRILNQIAAAASVVLLASAAASAQQAHSHGGTAATVPTFVASTAKPFAALMADAMAVMEDGMARAPMNGQADHDFAAMMLPHHQGAVDMAKALLLTTQEQVKHTVENVAAYGGSLDVIVDDA